jgi:threonine dehydratase
MKMSAGDNFGSQTLERRAMGSESMIERHGMLTPAIGDDGRIRLPGVPAGFSIASYLPLMHLYASILEANRILDRYREQLSLFPVDGFQAPLTALEASSLMPNLFYKREDQTITQAYKVRGAVVGMAKIMEDTACRRFLAVSTGNHALGVLRAAQLLRPDSVRLVVPKSTAPGKLEKINARIGALQMDGVEASLVYAGKTFDEARDWAMAQEDGEYYLDPYSDPWVVAGQGTIGLELFHQMIPLLEGSDVEEVVVVAPVGGGGLLAGTATALKMAAAWDPRFRAVNVKFVGLQLKSLETVYGDAIRVKETASTNRMLFSSLGVDVMTLEDAQMAEGMRHVHQDLGVYVEGASGGTVIPVLHEKQYAPTRKRLVVSVLSGGNVNVLP